MEDNGEYLSNETLYITTRDVNYIVGNHVEHLRGCIADLEQRLEDANRNTKNMEKKFRVMESAQLQNIIDQRLQEVEANFQKRQDETKVDVQKLMTSYKGLNDRLNKPDIFVESQVHVMIQPLESKIATIESQHATAEKVISNLEKAIREIQDKRPDGPVRNTGNRIDIGGELPAPVESKRKPRRCVRIASTYSTLADELACVQEPLFEALGEDYITSGAPSVDPSQLPDEGSQSPGPGKDIIVNMADTSTPIGIEASTCASAVSVTTDFMPGTGPRSTDLGAPVSFIVRKPYFVLEAAADTSPQSDLAILPSAIDLHHVQVFSAHTADHYISKGRSHRNTGSSPTNNLVTTRHATNFSTTMTERGSLSSSIDRGAESDQGFSQPVRSEGGHSDEQSGFLACQPEDCIRMGWVRRGERHKEGNRWESMAAFWVTQACERWILVSIFTIAICAIALEYYSYRTTADEWNDYSGRMLPKAIRRFVEWFGI